MARAPPNPMTVEEFLEWERSQEERYELVDGIVWAMVGGTADHARIAGNVFAALRAGLRGRPCEAFVEAMKVVTASEVYYPDVVVTCSPVDAADDRVAEPVVVVEVLSRSTEARDRGPKWLAYQALPSLRHYVLISRSELRVEHYRRQAAGWQFEVLGERDAVLRLDVLEATLTLAAIYEDTVVLSA